MEDDACSGRANEALRYGFHDEALSQRFGSPPSPTRFGRYNNSAPEDMAEDCFDGSSESERRTAGWGRFMECDGDEEERVREEDERVREEDERVRGEAHVGVWLPNRAEDSETRIPMCPHFVNPLTPCLPDIVPQCYRMEEEIIAEPCYYEEALHRIKRASHDESLALDGTDADGRFVLLFLCDPDLRSRVEEEIATRLSVLRRSPVAPSAPTLAGGAHRFSDFDARLSEDESELPAVGTARPPRCGIKKQRSNGGALFRPSESRAFPPWAVKGRDSEKINRYVLFASDARLGPLSGTNLYVWRWNSPDMVKTAQNVAERREVADRVRSLADLEVYLKSNAMHGLPVPAPLLHLTAHYLFGSPFALDLPVNSISASQKEEYFFAYFCVHGRSQGMQHGAEQPGGWRDVIAGYERCGWFIVPRGSVGRPKRK